MTRRDEDALQRSAIELLNRKYRRRLIAYHTPNGGLRRRSEAARFAGLGVLPGVPDLTLAIRGGRLAYIELKTARGRLNPSQLIFREACASLGIPYKLCRSIHEVDAVTTEILESLDG